MKKIVCLMLAMLMVIGCIAVSGCGKKVENTVIKIGATGPLFGGAAQYGTACKNAAEIAVEEINALGGLQFEIKYEDDTHDAEKAVNAYNSLKDWGMQISLGSVTTAPAQATSVLNFEDRIFAITPTASGYDVVDGKDNVYQMCFIDPTQGTASADYIASKGLGSKIAVIWKNDDPYSKGIYDTFIAKAAELGLEIVSDTTFTSDSQSDFSVQVLDAKNNGADLVFLPMYYDAASQILIQAHKEGYAPKFFGVDGMDGILTLKGFDPALAEGVMLLTPFNADASDEQTRSFVKKYREKYNEIPNQFAADAYDCVYAIYQACKAGGVKPSMSASEINDIMMQQFSTMTFDGLTGKNATWNADGTIVKSAGGMIIENGVYVGLD